jgi:glycosyltransferase involved in cell wall biosynthesis
MAASQLIVDVVIPARNEEESLPLVLRAIPRDVVRTIYVVDNGSTDATAKVAVQGGAQLLSEPNPGYGAALLRGVNELVSLPRPPDVVVFLDGDYADEPAELPWLLEPIRAGSADLVIGSRALGEAEPGAMALQQRIGTRVATTMIRMIYGQRYSDLGPFRAIRLPALVALGMSDLGSGWMVEMQVKAARRGLRIAEVPVSYRRRVGGRSKISQTIKGSVETSYKIVFTILRHATAR